MRGLTMILLLNAGTVSLLVMDFVAKVRRQVGKTWAATLTSMCEKKESDLGEVGEKVRDVLDRAKKFEDLYSAANVPGLVDTISGMESEGKQISECMFFKLHEDVLVSMVEKERSWMASSVGKGVINMKYSIWQVNAKTAVIMTVVQVSVIVATV